MRGVIDLNKKGSWGFEEIAKLILALVVLVILIVMAYAFRDKSVELIQKIFGMF